MNSSILTTLAPLVLLMVIIATIAMLIIYSIKRKRSDQDGWTSEELARIEEFKQALLRERQKNNND